jgi:predicted DNA-binding transcriptional regulator AlpA
MTPLEFQLIDNQLEQLALSTKNTRDELNLTLKHIEHLKLHLTTAFEKQREEAIKPTVELLQPKDNSKPTDLLRIKEVIKMTSLSRSSIYSLQNKNKFPQPIQLGIRAVAWVRADILNWIKEKSNSNHQI